MTYSSILVQVETDSFPSARVHIAAHLAERFNARLIGLSAQSLRPPMVADGIVIDGELVEADRKEIETNLGLSEEKFRAAAGNIAREIQWRSAVDSPTDFLVQEARAADLIILGKSPNDRSRDLLHIADPGDVLMKAGRPVLLVPRHASSLSAARIMIAWKDTREARRAVRDALPLLANAKETVIVGIEGKDAAETARRSIEDLAGYLKAHGLSCRVDLKLNGAGPAGDELVRAAEDDNVDLIVAGAYGHTRLREWVFGGVTRTLLQEGTIPCLLSH